MKFSAIILVALFLGACDDEEKPTVFTTPQISTHPPFQGTIFLDPDIITAEDPTSFESLTPAGQASRVMFDRRLDGWITVDAYLFNVTFDDGLVTEVQVNPEFKTSALAQVQAEKYAIEIGRLPTSLRKDVETVWIHQGIQPFGGGNNNILIHIGQSDLYESDGILEETLVHEASHTSLDATHANAPGWVNAQEEDQTFISTYARDYPTREDIAETFLMYLAVKHRSDRISGSLKETITNTIPHRIKYLDNQTWNLYPLK